MTSDPVNHPPHYTFGRFEVLDVLLDWFPQNPLLWQVGKYLARASHKGAYLQDLRKARFYLDRAIALEESLYASSDVPQTLPNHSGTYVVPPTPMTLTASSPLPDTFLEELR